MHLPMRHPDRISLRFVVSMVLCLVLSTVHTNVQAADECSFDYVLRSGAIGPDFKDVTQKAAADQEAWKLLRQSLPNLQRALGSRDGYVLLVGWHTLPEDYSAYGEMQASNKLLESWALGKRTTNAGKDLTYNLAEGTPLAVRGTLNYVDNETSWRDIALDVIANSHCLFSMKFSGAMTADDDPRWLQFRSQFEQTRRVIETHEGKVAFSRNGRLFSSAGLLNIGIYIALAATIAGAAAYLLTRRYYAVPGKASQRYSIAIVLVCLLMISFTLIKAIAVGTTFETYDGAIILFVVLVLHAAAYALRSPGSILLALSFMTGLFAANAIYIALGWVALPTIQAAVGAALGVGLLWYALNGTLKPINQTQNLPTSAV